MSNIDKIKIEIERRIALAEKCADAACEKNLHNTLEANEMLIRQYKSLLVFIDLLPEEKPSEELEEAAENCVWNSIDSNDPTLVPKFIPLLLSLFISGAYWQKEQMMKDLEEDALLLERAWLTLDGFGHEELAERLKTFKEKYANKM